VVTDNVKVREEQSLLKRKRFGRLLMDASAVYCTLRVSVVIWLSLRVILLDNRVVRTIWSSLPSLAIAIFGEHSF